MAKVAGSLWVDGTQLHYVDKSGNEWYFVGTAGSTPAGAIVGSIWVDSASSTIHYIDSVGVDRAVAVEAGANRAGAGALPGSIWVDTVAAVNKSLHAINNIQIEQTAHTDIHNDIAASHTDTHGDAAPTHGDVAPGHLDHTDSPSSHGDVAHHDYHYDGHSDGYGGYDNTYWQVAKNAHGDVHDDAALEQHYYGWIHYDANPYTDHEDWPHADTVIVGHGDVPHVDTSHADGGPDFTSLGHFDGSWHSDGSALNPGWLQQPLTPGVSGSYTDSHYDYTVSSGGHDDATVGHTDTSTPHNDTHADITVPHTDTHFDQPTAV
jgi:hypothetical protein